MSHNQSDQVRECLNHTNGNTFHLSRGESRNQPSPTDPAGKAATSQNSSSCSASETSRGSTLPSQSESMDTSNASGSGTRPKHGMEQGPTNAFKKLKRLEDFSTEEILVKGHTVLIDVECFKKGIIVPYDGKHVWDANHVKLPYIYQQSASHQKSSASPSRWDVTRQALKRLTKGSSSIGDIQTAIMSYNSSNKDNWTFEALHCYGRNLHAKDNNLHALIPKMAKLALDLPELIKRPIPLLRRQQNQAITMSQQQISCLLANAFFCTFPHRNDTRSSSEYANFPTINFSSLFGRRNDQAKTALQAEKLRAIFHYFNTVTNENPDPASKLDGLVTFERICIPPSHLPKWNNQKKPLKELCISSKGSIEEEGTGMLQVDFACKFIGGGVLKSGLVQEEILFLMSPELIVSRLFTEKLDDNECLKITGPQMYNCTSGYSKTFSWLGPYDDHTERDSWKRRYRQIVAIDALDFKNPRDQYTKENITRELNKAYVGFQGNPKTAIATGNWGCGAFKGDPKLKALIQLMAAAVADRDMAFFTFGNEHLANEVQRMHDILAKKDVTVDKLYKLLKDYCGHYAREHQSPKDLYRYIKEKIGHNESLL